MRTRKLDDLLEASPSAREKRRNKVIFTDDFSNSSDETASEDSWCNNLPTYKPVVHNNDMDISSSDSKMENRSVID